MVEHKLTPLDEGGGGEGLAGPADEGQVVEHKLAVARILGLVPHLKERGG